MTAASGVRLVWDNRDLRVLAGYGWLGAVYVVSEGLAAPYADQLGSGRRASASCSPQLRAGP